jgi:predicted nucleic acid-binding protein
LTAGLQTSLRFFALRRKEIGRPVEMRDIMISGIALAHGARLATRNIRDFEHSGLDIVNPWETAL